MHKLLIVVTSFASRGDRIYSGSSEWLDGWHFNNDREIAIRSRSDTAVRYAASLDDLGSASASDVDAIVWIRGFEDDAGGRQQAIQRLIKQSAKDRSIHFAYHDPIAKALVSQCSEQLAQLGHYTLSKDGVPSHAARIQSSDGSRTYLDAMADFEALFSFFFVAPEKVIPWVKHKVTGALSAIDLDLQSLLESDFDPQQLASIASEHRARGGPTGLDECRTYLYRHERSLHTLYASIVPDEEIRATWSRLQDLLPRSEARKLHEGSPAMNGSTSTYALVRSVVEGLYSGDETKVRANFHDDRRGVFRRWLEDVQCAIDVIGRASMRRNAAAEEASHPIGVN